MPDDLERAHAVIQGIADGNDVSAYFSDTVAIGPGLIHAMSGDQVAFPIGGPMLIMFREEKLYFVGRFVKTGDGTRESFLASSHLRSIAKQVREGRTRRASQEERDLYGSLVPYEVDAQTVVVVEDDAQLFLLDTEEGRVIWMDMVSEYPIPSVAESTEDAMKITKRIHEKAAEPKE